MMRGFIQTLAEKPWQHESELTTGTVSGEMQKIWAEIIMKIFQAKK